MKIASHAARRPRARFERGASAVEYGLLIAGIAAVIALVVIAFGTSVEDLFTETCESFAARTSCA